MIYKASTHHLSSLFYKVHLDVNQPLLFIFYVMCSSFCVVIGTLGQCHRPIFDPSFHPPRNSHEVNKDLANEVNQGINMPTSDWR